MPLLSKILSYETDNLSKFLEFQIRSIADFLEIKTKIIVASENFSKKHKGQVRVIDICKELGATKYYNAVGGIALYDKEIFRHNDIELYFIQSNQILYQQYTDNFIANLSIIDALMFCGKINVRQQLKMFQLI